MTSPAPANRTLEVLTIDTPSLGDRSYVVTDGEVAVAVDPQRDHDRVLDLLRERGLRLSHVLETHIHNDYVTGGFALAAATGAQYCVNAEDEVSYERRPVGDGDVLEAGRMRVRVLATPGHTYTHLSYAVQLADDEQQQVVFTGGSLLYGSTGRPDLLGADHAVPLARHQHASAHRLVAELPEETEIFPTHGFGSFCAATPTTGDASTIGSQRASNPALQLDVDEWVEQTLASLTAYPAYYAHMAPANVAGPEAPDLSPPAPADPAELRRRIEAGEWVVDLRHRRDFAAGHLQGAFNFGDDGSFITYLGWIIPWGTPVTLLADTAEQVAEAQRDLARIGMEPPQAAATGRVEDWSDGSPLASYPRADFARLAAERAGAGEAGGPHVLDVRRDDERAGGFLTGSQHIPLHALLGRTDEVPDDRPVWVHCAAGYRASIAAAVLDRAGRQVVLVDDAFDRAGPAGLDLDHPHLDQPHQSLQEEHA